MTYIEESRRAALSRVVTGYLRVTPGPVGDLFVVKNFSCHRREGLFTALHVIKKIVRSEFEYAVNHTSEAQLIIRCTDPRDAERSDASNVKFKCDGQFITIHKLAHISLLPEGEDTAFNANIRSFHAHQEGISVVGYPVGYSDTLEDMENHINPHMSRSTMRSLGIVEGPVECMLKVNVKYSLTAAAFLDVIRVVPFSGHYTYAIDQDGSFYIKCDREGDAQFLFFVHFFINCRMIKFYRVQSVKKVATWNDKDFCPIYSRVWSGDHWEPVDV